MKVTAELMEVMNKLYDDFPYYAEKCLKIRTKEGGELQPFKLNPIQRKLHEIVLEEYEKKGRVRIILLKARQVGCSTYIEGSFFHKVTFRKGKQAYIFTHHPQATDQLFKMAKNFYDSCPKDIRPEAARSNQKEIYFAHLNSGYKIGTAKSDEIGRALTINYLHGSECAFWDNADKHAASLLPTVPDKDDTEIFIESTANGVANWYCQQYKLAEGGLSEYRAVFFPWFCHPDYQATVPTDFTMTDDEVRLAQLYELNVQQVYWRRMKVMAYTSHMGEGEIIFRQEFPSNAQEAFLGSGNPFIRPEDVEAARANQHIEGRGLMVMGVDPARSENGDRTAIVIRQGRVIFHYETFKTFDLMNVVGRVKVLIEKHKIAKTFIDVIGVGGGVLDRLKEMFDHSMLVGVNSAKSPTFDQEAYLNKRAEMWGTMKEWLRSPEGVRIPDKDDFCSDLLTPEASYVTSSGKLKIESKDDIKKKGLPSPDIADALSFTFAQPVNEMQYRPIQYPRHTMV